MAGIIVLVLGILLLLISVFADTLHAGGVPGFGYKQIIGFIAGIVVFVIGVIISRRNPKEESSRG